VIYAVATNGFETNRVIKFTAFIQWLLPTAIDVIAMIQAKDNNARSAAIAIVIQFIFLTCLSNYIVVPAFLKVINLI
jgi:hypothetical protein